MTTEPSGAEHPFIDAWNSVAERTHECAVSHGWWESDRNDFEMIALMHAELSEAVEALRVGNPISDHLASLSATPFSEAEEEFADVIIRIMDTCHTRGWNVAGAILAKIAYNERRPYRYGGKKA